MTEKELNKHGIFIEVEREEDFYPFRIPNKIEYATVYLNIKGHRKYIGYTKEAYYADASWLVEQAIRKGEKFLKIIEDKQRNGR